MLLTSELQGEVQEILETMTEDYRHILLLKYEYELSYKEIAILLSMKEDTVKQVCTVQEINLKIV